MTFLMLFFQELGRPRPDRRPPRHARPKGWTGPGERAPFPPVAEEQILGLAIPGLVVGPLSPLNREVLRRMLTTGYRISTARELV